MAFIVWGKGVNSHFKDRTHCFCVAACLIKALAERYESPLPTLVTETEALTKKVGAHLIKMGFFLN